MRKHAVVVALAATLSSCTRSSAGHLVDHEFSASAEGWQIAGDTGPATPTFVSSGGRSGGYISYTDQAVGETWYFQAPSSVLAQLAAAEGGRIEFTLKQDPAEAGFPDDDIVIVGPAGRLSYRFDFA